MCGAGGGREAADIPSLSLSRPPPPPRREAAAPPSPPRRREAPGQREPLAVMGRGAGLRLGSEAGLGQVRGPERLRPQTELTLCGFPAGIASRLASVLWK